MLRKFVLSVACAGAVIAPAVAEEAVRANGGKILLTAAQMDKITAGGLADAFANVTPEMIEVIVSSDGAKSSSSTASATMNIKYTVTPDGVYLDPVIETDYEGSAVADSQQADVQQDVVVPGGPPDDVPVPVEPEPVLTPAQRFAKANAIQSVYSVDSINRLISQLRNNLRNN